MANVAYLCDLWHYCKYLRNKATRNHCVVIQFMLPKDVRDGDDSKKQNETLKSDPNTP